MVLLAYLRKVEHFSADGLEVGGEVELPAALPRLENPVGKPQIEGMLSRRPLCHLPSSEP